MKIQFIFLSSLIIASFSFAEDSCDRVVQACQSAGFVQGRYREGNGLYGHCVNPLMQNISPEDVRGLIL